MKTGTAPKGGQALTRRGLLRAAAVLPLACIGPPGRADDYVGPRPGMTTSSGCTRWSHDGC